MPCSHMQDWLSCCGNNKLLKAKLTSGYSQALTDNGCCVKEKNNITLNFNNCNISKQPLSHSSFNHSYTSICSRYEWVTELIIWNKKAVRCTVLLAISSNAVRMKSSLHMMDWNWLVIIQFTSWNVRSIIVVNAECKSYRFSSFRLVREEMHQ